MQSVYTLSDKVFVEGKEVTFSCTINIEGDSMIWPAEMAALEKFLETRVKARKAYEERRAESWL